MPPPLKLALSEEQRRELERVRDQHPLGYMQERAAAILKIADGASGLQVARHLLNHAHWQDTVYEWVKRYRSEGIEGLKIRAGRGRKPAFSPSVREQGGGESRD
jgi:transposase